MKLLRLGSVLQLATTTALHLSLNEYAAVKSVQHPEHKILLKHNGIGESVNNQLASLTGNQSTIESVCPGATPGYTGYLVAGTKHFFFSYFQSRGSPCEDPLVLWTNGGPGCSGLIGMLSEHGPCQIQDDGSVIKNEHSWVNAANMIYLEQPLGTGFSFDSSNSSKVDTTWLAAKDLVIFLDLWYSHFPELKKNEFHLSGESYAGHYLPVFAKTIMDRNEVMHPEDQIPLKSVIVGNGQYDISIQEMTIYNMTCTAANGVGGALLGKQSCSEMEAVIPKCRKYYQDCEKTLSDVECTIAVNECVPYTQGEFMSSNHSIYDVRLYCPPEDNCLPLTQVQTDFWNNPKVRAAFGATDHAVAQWQQCNDDVFTLFMQSNDLWAASAPIMRELLDRGLRFLIYHGVYDVICNYIGAEEVLSSLDWHGLDAYHKASANPIEWSGGKYWEAENLRYSRVNNAGHLVPLNQPVAALELFEAWLQQRPMK